MEALSFINKHKVVKAKQEVELILVQCRSTTLALILSLSADHCHSGLIDLVKAINPLTAGVEYIRFF